MTRGGTRPGRVSVHLEVDGGFAAIPGLNRPFDADTDRLDAGDAEALRRLLAEADFFTRPAAAGAPAPGAADHRTYTITATQEGHSHTVRVSDPVVDPGLQHLVELLTAWQRRAR